MYDEAADHCKAALDITDKKPVFLFYLSSALFLSGRSKEGLLQLEQAMEKAPKLLKKFVELHPSILQNPQVVDIIARYKKGKKI